FPPGGLRSPHGRPTRQRLDPGRGFHVPHIRVTAGLGALFTPRPSGTLTASPIPPAAARLLCQGPGPITPACLPSPGTVYYEASSRVHSRSPARPSPSPVIPGWNGDFSGLHPGLRTRRQDLRRQPRRGTGIDHSPGATRPALPDLQFMSSLATGDLVSHDRHRHDPLPHRRTPGVVGQVRPQGQAVRRQKQNPAPPAGATRGPPAPSAKPASAPRGPKPSSAPATTGSPAAAASTAPWSRSATPSSPSPGTCCRTRTPLHRPRTRLARPARPLRRKRQLTAELQRLSGKKVLPQQEATA